jgi:hypothetical protein
MKQQETKQTASKLIKKQTANGKESETDQMMERHFCYQKEF